MKSGQAVKGYVLIWFKIRKAHISVNLNRDPMSAFGGGDFGEAMPMAEPLCRERTLSSDGLK